MMWGQIQIRLSLPSLSCLRVAEPVSSPSNETTKPRSRVLPEYYFVVKDSTAVGKKKQTNKKTVSLANLDRDSTDARHSTGRQRESVRPIDVKSDKKYGGAHVSGTFSSLTRVRLTWPLR